MKSFDRSSYHLGPLVVAAGEGEEVLFSTVRLRSVAGFLLDVMAYS